MKIIQAYITLLKIEINRLSQLTFQTLFKGYIFMTNSNVNFSVVAGSVVKVLVGGVFVEKIVDKVGFKGTLWEGSFDSDDVGFRVCSDRRNGHYNYFLWEEYGTLWVLENDPIP